MTLILDSGALIAYARGERTTRSLIARAETRAVPVLTTSGAVAQVWRGGPRQAQLAVLLRGVDEMQLTRQVARRIGILLGRTGSSDVVDASLVEVANHGDEILTSEPGDLARLAEAAGKRLVITRI